MNSIKRSRNVFTVISLILFAIFPSFSYSEASVWVAKKSGNTVYLGGTIHLLRPSDYPLPQEYQVAYLNSDEIFLEADVSVMEDPAFQSTIIETLFYKDGKNLKSELTPEAYQALASYAEKSLLPMQMLESMKPFLVIQTLIVGEFLKMGFTPMGVDVHFQKQALEDKKILGYFETVEEQLKMFDAMSEDGSSEFVLSQLEEMQGMEAMIEKLLNVWRKGDAKQIHALFVDEMKKEFPEIYKVLLTDRNNRWMPKIENMFSDHDSEFILVGVAHLIGEDGLVEKLRQKGYDVQKLVLPKTN